MYAAQYNALRRLTDEEMGFLFHQIFRWLNDEETEAGDWSSALFLAFQFLTLQITIDSEKYLQRKRRIEAARKSRKEQSSVKESETEESPSHARVNVNDNVNDNVNENVNENVVKEKTKREVFSKPTIEDITSYCRERNNNVDPQKFYDFYESKGWMVGKNKMKDWKACVRTWERNSPIAKASDYEEVLPNWMTQQEEELPEWMTPEMREEWQKMKTSKKQTTS